MNTNADHDPENKNFQCKFAVKTSIPGGAMNLPQALRSSFRDFFSVCLNSGLVIHGVSLHAKEGRKWLVPPLLKFENADGSTCWSSSVDFESMADLSAFMREAQPAIDAALTGAGKRDTFAE